MKKYKVISAKEQGIYKAGDLVREIETDNLIKEFPALEFGETFYDSQYNVCRVEEITE